ncbi:MAG: hypothetical protein C0594_04380 [Marinilabiliales bacterium]|nr:MAG: hypothetical protein C0594_04380 [Marinilabiliales bacterium]
MNNQHLITLLETESRIILPDFGAFIVKQGEQRSIIFNELLKFNDGLIVNYLVKSEGISKDEAEGNLAAFIQKISERLSAEKPYIIENVGVFYTDDKGKIQFDQYKDKAEKSKSVEKEASKPEEKKTKGDKKTEKKTVDQGTDAKPKGENIQKKDNKSAPPVPPQTESAVKQESSKETDEPLKEKKQDGKPKDTKASKEKQNDKKDEIKAEEKKPKVDEKVETGKQNQPEKNDKKEPEKPKEKIKPEKSVDGSVSSENKEKSSDKNEVKETVVASKTENEEKPIEKAQKKQENNKLEKKAEGKDKKEVKAETKNKQDKELEDQKKIEAKKAQDAKKKKEKEEKEAKKEEARKKKTQLKKEKEQKKKELREKKKTGATNKENTDKPEQKKKSMLWLWLLLGIGIPVVGLAVFVVLNLSMVMGLIGMSPVEEYAIAEISEEIEAVTQDAEVSPTQDAVAPVDSIEEENNDTASETKAKVDEPENNIGTEELAAEPAIEEPETVSEQAEETKPEKNVISPAPEKGNYFVVVGCFAQKGMADDYVQKIKSQGFDAHIFGKIGKYHAITTGSYSSMAEANKALNNFNASVDPDGWVYHKK